MTGVGGAGGGDDATSDDEPGGGDDASSGDEPGGGDDGYPADSGGDGAGGSVNDNGGDDRYACDNCGTAFTAPEATRTATMGDLDTDTWQTLCCPACGARVKTVFVGGR